MLDHLGVEVESTSDVAEATARLSGLGLFTTVENDTTCCYARQDKVWVRGPGAEPWEVYTVKADASEATSIHPLDQPESGPCMCGRPGATDGEQLDACCR